MDMNLDRRQFLKLGPAVPLVSMLLNNGQRFVAYAATSQVGPWIGWIDNSAGNAIGFVTRSGVIHWMAK